MAMTLKAARINKGYDQAYAAKLIGVGADTLSNYERGITYPDVPTIKKIEEVYGIKYDDIDFLLENYENIVKDATRYKEIRTSNVNRHLKRWLQNGS